MGTSEMTAASDGIALVTGATAGIGAVFADRLARRGYGLVIVARGQERLETEASRIRVEHRVPCEALAADLGRSADLARVEVRAAEGDIALLVNNAGFGTFGPFVEAEVEREEEEIRVLVVALMRLTRAALPGMIKRGRGGIINVSSVAGFQPGVFNATYGASKAFVNSFTQAVHEEARGTAVRVQLFCPGFTRTEFQTRNRRSGPPRPGWHIPGWAWQTPEQVVDASLRALDQGRAVCIPGIHNKAIAALGSKSPRTLVRRIAGVVGRRY